MMITYFDGLSSVEKDESTEWYTGQELLHALHTHSLFCKETGRIDSSHTYSLGDYYVCMMQP